jgi:chromate transporter
MKSDYDIELTLLINFAILSFLAIGGANSLVPELHRQVVDLRGWIGDREFSELFAIAQASPGPNVVFVTLLGYRVAGMAGALAATAAIIAPTCLMTYAVSRVFDRFKDSAWRNILQQALVTVTVGLFAASAFIIASAADQDWKTVAITAASFAVTYWTRISPLVPIAVAALLGIAGVP